ncbi:unnamed protein product [Pleuronectes platessa]|uniref:Uncharacterized protein n=1 Tax=Pleuronectes platessa TaxID=8262 RepID=A0A9N7YSL8_PLEPL|nr:unnamed protein product [Pleuronectes platessa]
MSGVPRTTGHASVKQPISLRLYMHTSVFYHPRSLRQESRSHMCKQHGGVWFVSLVQVVLVSMSVPDSTSLFSADSMCGLTPGSSLQYSGVDAAVSWLGVSYLGHGGVTESFASGDQRCGWFWKRPVLVGLVNSLSTGSGKFMARGRLFSGPMWGGGDADYSVVDDVVYC